MRVKIAVTDQRIPPEAERRLSILGFRVLTLPPCPTLPSPIASHTDMLLCRLGDEIISAADYCETAPAIFTDLVSLFGGTGVKLSFTEDTLGGEYPTDCRLNVLKMGNYLFTRVDSASPYIINKARAIGLTVVSVKQGYPACTVLKLDDGHAVTADAGMAEAMRSVGIKVTMIENGDISLPPYEYGFIGGCAGVLDGRIYFIGDPTTHRSYGAIRSACDECGLEMVSLAGGMLADLGGIFFAEGDLKEYGY